jgi:hypothetical protein
VDPNKLSGVRCWEYVMVGDEMFDLKNLFSHMCSHHPVGASPSDI